MHVFDAVYCINLDRRPDRWTEFLRRVPEDWPFKPVSRFPATDGQLCPKPAWWNESAGAWGCLRSHLRIIEDCLNSGFESVLIFEDDAVFNELFVRDLQKFLQNLPADWQMIYLGGQLLREGFRPPTRISDEVYRPYNINRTHAYAVRGAAMLRSLYEHLLSRDWFPKHHLDHHYGRLHQTGRYGVYVPRQWLVGQLGGPSDVSGEQTDTMNWEHPETASARGPEPFVAVLGVHESVASRVALALHHLGVHMGDDLGGAANANDAEDQALARLCEEAAPFPVCGIAMRDEEMRDRIEGWVGHHMWRARVRGKLAGAKYPHLCALGFHFKAACGSRLKVIDVREPLGDAISSLQKRLRSASGAANDAQSDEVQRWLLLEKEMFLASVPHLSLGRASIEEDPDAALSRLIAYLDLSPSQEQIHRARQVLMGNPASDVVPK